MSLWKPITSSSEYDVVGAYIALSCVVAICYSHNKFCYSGSDAVYPRYRVFPFPVYEKAYSCMAIACPR